MAVFESCPFCGSDKVHIDAVCDVFSCYCENCFSYGPEDTSKTKAVELWNERLKNEKR